MGERAEVGAGTVVRVRRRVPPGLLKRKDAAAYCGHGESTWDRATAAGLNPAPIRTGAFVFWGRRELDAWIARGCPPRAEWEPLWAAIVAAETARPD